MTARLLFVNSPYIESFRRELFDFWDYFSEKNERWKECFLRNRDKKRKQSYKKSFFKWNFHNDRPTLVSESAMGKVLSRQMFLIIAGNSCPKKVCKKGVPRNFAKFTGKHLCQSLFFHNVFKVKMIFLSLDANSWKSWTSKR